MNTVISNLYQQKEGIDKKLKELNYELKSIEDCLHNELYKETRALNEVLKNNLIEIINMIHKIGLKCSSVYNAETMWNDTVYKVSDGGYFANIIAKNGKIVRDLTDINNDGGGKKLYEKVEVLIDCHITPFCNKEKYKYYK